MTPTAPLYAGYGYQLPVKPNSATKMWNAWHDTGTYAKKPIEGGIPTLKKDFSGWHHMYSKSKRKTFSNWKIAVNCMKEEIELVNSVSILDQLDSLFKLVSSFSDLLKKQRKDQKGETSEVLGLSKLPAKQQRIEATDK